MDFNISLFNKLHYTRDVLENIATNLSTVGHSGQHCMRFEKELEGTLDVSQYILFPKIIFFCEILIIFKIFHLSMEFE